MPNRIVTTVYRSKRPPRKWKAAPALQVPAIVATASRKRARLQRAEQATEPDDDPEAAAAMRAWLERAKWGHGSVR